MAGLPVPIIDSIRVTAPGVAAHDLVDRRVTSPSERVQARAQAEAGLRNLLIATGRDPQAILCFGRDPAQAERAAAFLAARATNPALTWSQHLDTWEPPAAFRKLQDWVEDLATETHVDFLVRRVSDSLIRGFMSLTRIRVVERVGDVFYFVAQPQPAFSAPSVGAYWTVCKALLARALEFEFAPDDPADDRRFRLVAWEFPLGNPGFLWPASTFSELAAYAGAVVRRGNLHVVPSPSWPPPPSYVPPEDPLG